jgi:hypothetical protein
MKKFLSLIILYSSFIIALCPSTHAQWEGAQVQRLTYNTSVNRMFGLCIDKNDKLFLFYRQWWWDPWQQPYRDTLLLMTKEKGGEWSQPETISAPSQQEVWGAWYIGYDQHTEVIHLFSQRSETLYYTNSNMPNWEMVKTDSGPDRVYPGGIMAFDTLGNIHLAWNVDFDSIGYNWYRVMYANNSTGQWVKQQVSPPIWLGGMRSGGLPGFGVQKNGTAHIIYQGEPYCDTECVAFYARNDSLNSTNWITDTVPKPPRTLWQYGAFTIKVDVNDRVHLITAGCIEEDCVWPGMTRTFYYYKQTDDSVWQGPEQIPDTMFGFRSYIPQLLVDKQGVPYMGCQTTSMEAYFTDRKEGNWQVPYLLVGWNEDPDSLQVDDFCFVLDSQGKGHGAFVALHLRQLYYDDDSLEIYYLSSNDSFVDTSQEQKIFNFRLFQNYPNPFNSATSIQYTVASSQSHPIHTTLKIYNILGREVRELVNTRQSPGNYTVSWDGKNNQGKEVASGIYFYQLKAGEYKQTKKLVLIK